MRLSHATRITIGTAVVLVLGTVSSLTALVAAHSMHRLITGVVENNIASVEAADRLEAALLEQRGLVSLHVLDSTQDDALEQLERRKAQYDHWYATARRHATTQSEQLILDQLAAAYSAYDAARERVVVLHAQGRSEEARALLLSDVQRWSGEAHRRCQELSRLNHTMIESAVVSAGAAMQRARITVMTAGGLALVFGGLLVYLLLRHVILPLRRMAREAAELSGLPLPETSSPYDELNTLGARLSQLSADVHEARSSLETQAEDLARSRHLATAGKLAACLAHEVRNPLAALKMWLFAIHRNVRGNPDLEHRCEVMADEVRHLERIVQDFLEFARPPQLVRESLDVRTVLNATFELFEEPMRQRNLRFVHDHNGPLPRVSVDGGQIKQVFLNLLSNALEAVQEEGEIRVTEHLESREDARFVVVRFADTGPGIPLKVRARLFEPFMTTKEGGTGLGLAIASSIMTRHGGALELEHSTASGTTFAVRFPVAGD